MKQKLKLSTDSLAQIHLDPLKYVSKEEAVKFLRDIVKIPSVTGDEQALGEFIAGFLEDNGIETQVIHTTKRSPNVLGWLRGHGDGPSLMINGHMDTVPVCKGWTYDPYAAKVTDGRLYGHCVRDQKVGVAVQVLTALAVKRSEIPLRGDLCAAKEPRP
jgi:acetylornithine deacetylase/succinyl-diaminopimelate desuccinylase-like protein